MSDAMFYEDKRKYKEFSFFTAKHHGQISHKGDSFSVTENTERDNKLLCTYKKKILMIQGIIELMRGFSFCCYSLRCMILLFAKQKLHSVFVSVCPNKIASLMFKS